MKMSSGTMALFLAPLIVAVSVEAASARHYDCTKAGNANKSECKAAGAAGVPAPATAASALPAPDKPARHYDCSKPGNAKKAACLTAAAPAAKPGLFGRLTGKPAATPAPATSTLAVSTPMAKTAPGVAPYAGKSITTDAAGATGQCKDGSYTHATHHSGACSHHGGVAKWM